MKTLFTIICSCPLWVMAQQIAVNPTTANQQLRLSIQQVTQKEAQLSFPTITIDQVQNSGCENAINFCKQNMLEVQHPQVTLKVLSSTQSKVGFHYTFEQQYAGIGIYNAYVKINTTKQGNILSISNALVSVNNWSTPIVSINANKGQPFWVDVNGMPKLVYVKKGIDDVTIQTEIGEILTQQDTRFYNTVDDTIATGKVFRPDPLTTAGVIYGQGGTFKHFNDSDYALLNNERVDVEFPATFETGNFTLKNEFVQIVDLRSPNIIPVQSASGDFDFLRSKNGFKDVMCLYHITNTQLYLHSLGFNEVNFSIKTDAHSGTGDQSYFSFTDTSLNFGTGGIPDAEDADVIVHEFTHAVSFSITPSGNVSNERRAIEEGLCDVLAAVYSKKYTSFNWRLLFNWDAPNPITAGNSPFWQGRNGNSSKTYANLSGNPYADSEIWSSTLLDIAEQIGDDSTVVLLLSSLSSYTDNTTMPQAAQLFMQADSVIMNKAFGWKIGPVFNARGLGDFKTSIQEQQFLLKKLEFINTANFALAAGNAMLQLPTNATIEIYNMQGKLIQQQVVQKGLVEFNPEQFLPGMYIVVIQTEFGSTSLKLVKSL